jgi:hypothetical protein
MSQREINIENSSPTCAILLVVAIVNRKPKTIKPQFPSKETEARERLRFEWWSELSTYDVTTTLRLARSLIVGSGSPLSNTMEQYVSPVFRCARVVNEN